MTLFLFYFYSMNMSSNKDSIPIRLAKLNQQIEGKVPASSLNHLILKDGLLDSLLALYDECKRKANLTQKNPPRHFSGFLHRGTFKTSLNL